MGTCVIRLFLMVLTILASTNSPNYCPESFTLVCYGSNNTNTLTTANSIYNSGKISVERKATDFTFLAAYTFAKGLDDSSAFGDLVNFENPKLSRGLSSTDVTSNFVASYIWALPFDRPFANGPKRLTQGWQIQGITRFSTGFPIQMNQADGDFTLWGSSATDMPNRVGPVQIVNPRKVNTACLSYDPTIPGSGTGCYFLPSAFAVNMEPGTFGTANRRFFHGPGFNNTDFGLLKHTVIHEDYAFDLRIEFFNIFNHTQFMNPTGNITDSSFGLLTRPFLSGLDSLASSFTGSRLDRARRRTCRASLGYCTRVRLFSMKRGRRDFLIRLKRLLPMASAIAVSLALASNWGWF
jgi:hypothetical protein